MPHSQDSHIAGETAAESDSRRKESATGEEAPVSWVGSMADAAVEKGRPIWIELLIIATFTLLITVPFLNQPFHMDDPGFIEFARARQDAPLTMELRDYVFFGKRNESFIDTHPPLISSYIALVMYASGGESEMLYHGAFLIFPLLAGVSMYFLSRRFIRNPLLVTLLLMGTPGMMVMSHTLMSDIPGLSFWLATVALYIYGLDRRSTGLMALCAVTMTLGIFTSYQVLSVIPLLLVYAAARRRLTLLSFLPFTLPLSSFASYLAWHFAVVGGLPRFSYGEGDPMAWYSIIKKISSAMVTLAEAAVFFGILYRVLVARAWDYAVYLVLLIPIAFAIFSQYLGGYYSGPAALLAILLMPLGMLMIYQFYSRGWEWLKSERSRPEQLAKSLLLLLWLGGVLFYVVVLMPYSSVRYLLPLFPPLILLLARLMEERFTASAEQLRNLLLAGILSTTGLGLLVSAADLEFAESNRTLAQTEARAMGAELSASGNQLWFVGEFSLRYYMEQEGFQELPLDAVPATGDIIIQSPLGNWRPFSEDVDHRVKKEDEIHYGGVNPFRVTSYDANAGFYGSFWGVLPFSLAGGDVEKYLVYRMQPPNDEEGWMTRNWKPGNATGSE
ncbi:MAG: glycosyltransferase family 39 protein [Thermoleophilia bacterium]|nr:glycosyltransferase family 39 protein [Thermoleophilia bacterium]